MATARSTTTAKKHAILPRAPLVLVVCQVRFPAVFRVSSKEFVAGFQEAIRDTYPLAAQEHELNVVLGPQGMQQTPASRQWRFSDRERSWTLVLSESFMALETRRYSGADGFLERLSSAVAALAEHIKPASVERLGMRYVNEIHHPDALTADAWKGRIVDHFLGVLASDLARTNKIEQSLQEISLLGKANEKLVIRQGFLPEGTTVVPMPSANADQGPFYLLDMDHFTTAATEFAVGDVLTLADRFHDENWRMFRAAVTDELYSFFEREE
jgi:uncharacterized protein (TIGR04255 family)